MFCRLRPQGASLNTGLVQINVCSELGHYHLTYSSISQNFIGLRRKFVETGSLQRMVVAYY